VHPGEAGGQARHLLIHFDPAQAAVAVEVGGGEALLEAALALGLPQRALGLVPGAQLGADDVAVAVGIDGVELLQQPATASMLAVTAVPPPGACLCRLLELGAADAAVAVGVEPGDAEPGAAVGKAMPAMMVLVAAARVRGIGARGRFGALAAGG